MSFIKMFKMTGPSIDPLGTPYKFDFDSGMVLSIFAECVLLCK